MTGPAPALPEPCFSYGDPDGTYHSPSWSPDGGRIAFEDSGGRGGDRILVGAVPSLAAGCAMPSEGGKTVLENARQPDWGPADVPSGSTQKPGDQPSPGNGAPVGDVTGESLKVSVARTTLAKALRKGVTVKLTAPSAGRFKARVLRGSRVVATGGLKAKAAGPAKLKVRFSTTAKRTLRRAGTARLKLRITFSAPGAERVTTTRKIVLR